MNEYNFEFEVEGVVNNKHINRINQSDKLDVILSDLVSKSGEIASVLSTLSRDNDTQSKQLNSEIDKLNELQESYDKRYSAIHRLKYEHSIPREIVREVEVIFNTFFTADIAEYISKVEVELIQLFGRERKVIDLQTFQIDFKQERVSGLISLCASTWKLDYNQCFILDRCNNLCLESSMLRDIIPMTSKFVLKKWYYRFTLVLVNQDFFHRVSPTEDKISLTDVETKEGGDTPPLPSRLADVLEITGKKAKDLNKVKLFTFLELFCFLFTLFMLLLFLTIGLSNSDFVSYIYGGSFVFYNFLSSSILRNAQDSLNNGYLASISDLNSLVNYNFSNIQWPQGVIILEEEEYVYGTTSEFKICSDQTDCVESSIDDCQYPDFYTYTPKCPSQVNYYEPISLIPFNKEMVANGKIATYSSPRQSGVNLPRLTNLNDVAYAHVYLLTLNSNAVDSTYRCVFLAEVNDLGYLIPSVYVEVLGYSERVTIAGIVLSICLLLSICVLIILQVKRRYFLFEKFNLTKFINIMKKESLGLIFSILYPLFTLIYIVLRLSLVRNAQESTTLSEATADSFHLYLLNVVFMSIFLCYIFILGFQYCLTYLPSVRDVVYSTIKHHIGHSLFASIGLWLSGGVFLLGVTAGFLFNSYENWRYLTLPFIMGSIFNMDDMVFTAIDTNNVDMFYALLFWFILCFLSAYPFAVFTSYFYEFLSLRRRHYAHPFWSKAGVDSSELADVFDPTIDYS